jgi:hypothetical protein
VEATVVSEVYIVFVYAPESNKLECPTWHTDVEEAWNHVRTAEKFGNFAFVVEGRVLSQRRQSDLQGWMGKKEMLAASR